MSTCYKCRVRASVSISDARGLSGGFGPAAILALTYVIYAAAAAWGVVNGRIWLDEALYIQKSWAYVTGAVHPYSAQDATWYMPLYFYQLGWAQELFGQGHITGRVMSAVCGGASGILVYLICRRVSLAPMIAALAVAIYLLTPTTAYYFSGATPLATVAFLNLLAVYLVVASRGAPRLAVSAALGVLFAVLFFYRQNMILSVAVLAPAYLYAIGRDRARQGTMLALTALVVAGLLVGMFPERMTFYALRLPVITPLLEKLSVLPTSWAVIEVTSTGRYALSPDLSGLLWRDPVNAFLLPYFGTVVLAASLLVLRGPPPILRLTAAFFFFLSLTHYLGSAGYCSACILTYASYFIALGAIAAAAAIDILWRQMSQRGAKPALLAALGAACLVLNASGTQFSIPDADGTLSRYRVFPWPLMQRFNGLSDLDLAHRLSEIVARTIPEGSKVLVIHNLSALPYAVSLAGRTMPVQDLNLRQSYRQLRPGLSAAEQETARTALEGESFWSDETLMDWLDHGVDAVMLQDGALPLSDAARASLAQHFIQTANVVYLGAVVGIYVRRSEAH